MDTGAHILVKIINDYSHLRVCIYFYIMDPVILSPPTKKVSYVIHLSDIHIRTGDLEKSRYREYEQVFDELVESISKLDHLDESVLVLTGDIFHHKGKIEPSGIRLAQKLLTQLLEDTDVCMICGNHDYRQDNPGIPDLPGIPRAAAQIHKLNPSNTTNEEHLHEKMDWEEKQGTSIPHLDQPTLKAHKDAADWHTGEYLRAKESGDTKKQLFHKRRMEHHLFRDGMIHLMVRDIKEESESIDEGTTKYWNKQKKRSWLRKKGYATSSVDSTSVKNTAALAVRNARDIMKKEEVESIDERKSSDPKGLAYKVTAASHAANPEWGPPDHTQDPQTHFGTAATRSSTLAAIKAIRGIKKFDVNNPEHVEAVSRAIHGSPSDYEGNARGWSQTAMTHPAQTDAQKERRAKLTGPYDDLSEPEKEKDRQIARTVATNIKKK